MNKIKVFLVPLLILFSGLKADKESSSLAKWVVMKGGSLKVAGSTNVNNFTCEIKNYSKPDTITIYRGKSAETFPLAGGVNLDIKEFDCFNPVMTADLRKTLKSKEYPFLKIRFLTLSKFPSPSVKQDFVKGLVDIELAGVKKRFDVSYKFSAVNKNTLQLIGDRAITFTDFNLTPPRKLGGMIKTNNELAVRFELTLHIVD